MTSLPCSFPPPAPSGFATDNHLPPSTILDPRLSLHPNISLCLSSGLNVWQMSLTHMSIGLETHNYSPLLICFNYLSLAALEIHFSFIIVAAQLTCTLPLVQSSCDVYKIDLYIEDLLTKSDLKQLTHHHHPLILWVQTPSSRGSSPDICPAKPSCHILLRSQSWPQHCLNTSTTALAQNFHLGAAIQHLHLFDLKLYLGEDEEVVFLCSKHRVFHTMNGVKHGFILLSYFFLIHIYS